MEEQISADNPVVSGSDNPTGPEPTTNGTGMPDGQPTGAGPAVDLFKGIDPNKLPPEAKAHYDSMLRDYREKTGKLSETIKSESAKAAEAYKQKAELYDQVAGSDEFVKMWNDFVQKQWSSPESSDPVTELKSKFEAMQMKIAQTEMHQVTDAFAEAVNEKGEKMHPDFDRLNSFVVGKRGNEDFSLLRAGIELAQGNTPQEKLANGYKAAKQLHDQIFEAGKKAGMGRLQTKVLNGTNPPSGSNGELLTVTEKKPKSASEAFAMAKKGIVVSR